MEYHLVYSAHYLREDFLSGLQESLVFGTNKRKEVVSGFSFLKIHVILENGSLHAKRAVSRLSEPVILTRPLISQRRKKVSVSGDKCQPL